jgi:hypothetical protein
MQSFSVFCQRVCLLVGLAALLATSVFAQESPYFITYDHHLEEPGSLEVSPNVVLGSSKGVNAFAGSWLELEYGAKAWWTTELYLEGQSTSHDTTLFTGFRSEHRFRVLAREHRINPVLYIEFEDINGANKTLKEFVGFDSKDDQTVPNPEARRERKREFETKFILSSDYRGWNLSENLIAEKNLQQGTWEFGYAAGFTRPLRQAATASECVLCRENFSVGLEGYGGTGTWHDLTLHETSQYLAPVIAWNLPSGTTFKLSTAFGLTNNSYGTLIRFGVSHEISRFDRHVKEWFR